jgi:ferritin-like metal-binding protein YciE
MTALRSPEDMFTTELKEIHSAERQLSRAIPRLSKKVSSQRLRDLLEQRLEQGEALIERLEDALDEMEAPKARPKNIAAEGLIDDVNQHLDEVEDERLIDPLLLASVQKIEHYCIAAWGAARSMGELLGKEDVVKTMEEVLKEGKELDDEMTKLAEEEINPKMMSGAEGAEDEEEDEEENGSSGSEGRSGRSSRGSKRSKSN